MKNDNELIQREPTLYEKAVSWAGSKIAQKLADGYEIERVSDEEQQRRIAVCEGCEFFLKNRTCELCLCPMDYKTQLLYNPFNAALGIAQKRVECPKKKW